MGLQQDLKIPEDSVLTNEEAVRKVEEYRRRKRPRVVATDSGVEATDSDEEGSDSSGVGASSSAQSSDDSSTDSSAPNELDSE